MQAEREKKIGSNQNPRRNPREREKKKKRERKHTNLGASGDPTSTTICSTRSNSRPIKLALRGANGLDP
jgi:hypothetical protein